MVQWGQLKKHAHETERNLQMKQYALFFIKQNERFVVKLYEPEILHCLIDRIEAGYILHYIQEVK